MPDLLTTELLLILGSEPHGNHDHISLSNGYGTLLKSMQMLFAISTMLQARTFLVRFPMRSLDFFNWPNPSSRTMALGSTQPLTEMSTRNFPGGKGRPRRMADKLPSVNGLCKNLGASTPLTGIALPFNSYFTGNTLRLRYKAQPVNVV
jgi:hypothetical protein